MSAGEVLEVDAHILNRVVTCQKQQENASAASGPPSPGLGGQRYGSVQSLGSLSPADFADAPLLTSATHTPAGPGLEGPCEEFQELPSCLGMQACGPGVRSVKLHIYSLRPLQVKDVKFNNIFLAMKHDFC